MKTVFSLKQNQRCAARTQLLEHLSEADLHRRKTATEEMLVVVGSLGILVIGMALWSGLYPLALTSVSMQPAFSEYLTRRRAIVKRLNQLK